MKKLWDNFDSWLGGAIMLVIVVAGFIQVVARFVFNHPLDWTEELMIMSFVWLIYVGSGACTKDGSHVHVAMFFEMLPPVGQKILEIIDDLLFLAFTVLLFYFSWQLTWMAYVRHATSFSLYVPMWTMYISVNVGMVLMFVRRVELMVKKYILKIKVEEVSLDL